MAPVRECGTYSLATSRPPWPSEASRAYATNFRTWNRMADVPTHRRSATRRCGPVAWAGEFEPALPLIAGGKSFGGRMTSQAQALDPLPGVRGLAFLGFPLHPPQKPDRKSV